MLAGVVGLLWHYLQPGAAHTDLLSFSLASSTFSADTSLISSVRSPIALAGAVFVGLFYLLARRLLSAHVAAIAALLVALSPFQAAQSRVLHTDALITAFMVISILSILGYWLQGWRWYWLIISGICAGLALLTKPVSWVLIPNLIVLGLFSLFYCRQTGIWQGRKHIWRMVGGWLAWDITAIIVIFALFPALWIMPVEVITTSLSFVTALSSAGHPHYFLGAPTQDPGILFYPVGWLLHSSPLELIGIGVLVATVLYAVWKQRTDFLRRQITNRPIEVALLIYVGMLILYATASPKKMVRYSLPAFPVIDIFVAYGLIWLWDKMANLRSGFMRQWPLSLLYGLVIVVQGWLLASSYPYYFTYFNPLLGGASTAVWIMGISWGEGMDKAATYLNQLPNAENLTVSICRGDSVFEPFFVGDKVLPCAKVEQIMSSDYIVYYLWNRMTDSEDYYWPYFRDHQLPEYRATLAGVDYALVYRHPAQHRASPLDNRLENFFTVYGFDLEDDGTLKLYWHNQGLIHQQLSAGLASPAGGETYWLPCEPAPGFSLTPLLPDSIVESVCSLAAANAPANLYDLELAVSDEIGISPVASSGLAFVSVTSNHIELMGPQEILSQIARQRLPIQATPLDITYGDRMRLIGYQLEPLPARENDYGEITLYWQPIRKPDVGLAQAFELEIQLLSNTQNNQPLANVVHPIFTQPVIPADTPRGSIVPIKYSLPQTISKDSANLLRICLKISSTGQIVPAELSDIFEQIECVLLPTPK